ncbi:MAG: hypothetical protein CFH37_00584 [Alphaproteobacteria bacterium MarineAlpha9_Bin7]|nr:MAG: hypothetical protein CFH37_00584 [Alphaproteobacteria bacterium MarineAlpha9_Bin7]
MVSRTWDRDNFNNFKNLKLFLKAVANRIDKGQDSA